MYIENKGLLYSIQLVTVGKKNIILKEETSERTRLLSQLIEIKGKEKEADRDSSQSLFRV